MGHKNNSECITLRRLAEPFRKALVRCSYNSLRAARSQTLENTQHCFIKPTPKGQASHNKNKGKPNGFDNDWVTDLEGQRGQSPDLPWRQEQLLWKGRPDPKRNLVASPLEGEKQQGQAKVVRFLLFGFSLSRREDILGMFEGRRK